jgi:hypothetical protein
MYVIVILYKFTDTQNICGVGEVIGVFATKEEADTFVMQHLFMRYPKTEEYRIAEVTGI